MTPAEWAYRMRAEMGLRRAQEVVDYLCTKDFRVPFYRHVRRELTTMAEVEADLTELAHELTLLREQRAKFVLPYLNRGDDDAPLC